MLVLILAAALWLGVHIGVAGTPWRGALVARIGEGGFRAAFSIASVASLSLLVIAWRGAPLIPLWSATGPLIGVVDALMLVSSVLFVAAIASPNPTAIGGEGKVVAVRGVQRVTRHPGLWSFALWGLVHMAANGDVASEIFFGAIAVTALAGMPSIDRKVAARQPETWAILSRETSILPFGAIAAGRTRFIPGEIPVLVWVGGIALWAVLIWAHPHVIGVPALPV